MLLDFIKTIATVAVPVVVAVLGHRLSRRLKLWESNQWRNQELIKARLQYYGQLAPMINDLMCYLTFVGHWKDLTPPEIIKIKREADRLFHSVSPLYSQQARDAYRAFISACFREYSGWGQDARILSGFVRRREAQSDLWDNKWDELFDFEESKTVPAENLAEIRDRYDRLLATLAEDIELYAPRTRYVTQEAFSLWNVR